MIKKVIVALSLLLAAVMPATAQFADQATYAGAGAGTANAQTLTLPNASSYADLVGVIIKYFPGATNTGGATLTVNGFGSSPAFRKPSGSGVTALTGGELASGQPTLIMYDGTYFDIVAPAVLPIGAGNMTTTAFGYNAPPNLQLNATVSANQLTIAVETSAGTDATSANPIPIAFRDTTIANGDPVWLSLTSALSFTIGSGSTMGCVNSQMCRLWVVVMNNAGTPQLCAINTRSGSNVLSIDEAALQSSASGTSGGSSAQTYYCNGSSVTSKAARIIGYVEIKETAAGTWATGPTYVQLFGPGIKRPGDVVQIVNAVTTSSNNSTSTSFAVTNSSLLITPRSEANVIIVDSAGTISENGSTVNSLAGLFRAANATPACTTQFGSAGGINLGLLGVGIGVSLNGADFPGTTSQTAYTVCVKISGASSVDYCTWPGTLQSCTIRAMEIMSRREHDNDDDEIDVRKVG